MCGDQRCDAWISLESVGIHAHGCLRSPSWMQEVTMPCYHSIVNPTLYVDLPHETLTCIRTVAHGTFGFIDLAQWKTTEGAKEVYVKRPIHAGKPLLQEACVQHWVADRLERGGFSHGAPKVVRIFSLRDRSICFAMEAIEGATTWDQFLHEVPTADLPSVLYEGLHQIGAMLWHIHHVLGMNHRDVKPSNFLMVQHAPLQRTFQFDHKRITMMTRYTMTFIDFGFACIGSPRTQRADLSLSQVFSLFDPCPKEGRDLYLLIGLLYIDYSGELGTLRPLFESWLQERGASLCKMMQKDKESSKKWLYFIAGHEDIKRFPITPVRMLQDLQKWVT